MKAARILQEELASRGYSVDLLDIGQGARFLPARYRALVLLSPVRGGLLMPQALEFIAENAQLTMPVLVMLTGWFPGLFEDHDLPALKESLQARGTALKAAVKVGTGFGKRLVRERVAVLADAMAGGE